MHLLLAPPAGHSQEPIRYARPFRPFTVPGCGWQVAGDPLKAPRRGYRETMPLRASTDRFEALGCPLAPPPAPTGSFRASAAAAALSSEDTPGSEVGSSQQGILLKPWGWWCPAPFLLGPRPCHGPRREAWKPGFLVCPAQPSAEAGPWHPAHFLTTSGWLFPEAREMDKGSAPGFLRLLGPDCLLSCSQLLSSEDGDTDPPHVWAYGLHLMPGPSTTLGSQPGCRPTPCSLQGWGLTPACWGQGLLWKEPTCLKGPT